MIKEITIYVHVDDDTMFTVHASSFESAMEQLGKIERKVEKLQDEA